MSALTPQEKVHVRTALRFLHGRCGTWELTAKAIGGIKATTVGQIGTGHKPVTANLAVRIARIARVPVDDVLTGRFPQPGACPHCGQPMPTQDRAAVGGPS